MAMMTGLIISITISLLIILTLGVAVYKFVSKKKIVEHYYTPLDHIFGQSQIEHHLEKIEKKEMEENDGDDKD